MKVLSENYIRKQQIDRWNNLSNYILEVYKDFYREELWKTPLFRELVSKFRQLTFEFKDLSNHLDLSQEELETDLLEIKCLQNICVMCGAGRLLECRCFRCKSCERLPEICFCKH